jgi:serine acetyltransferase
MYFGRIGSQTKIIEPLRLKHTKNIFIGSGVTVSRHAFLLTLTLPGTEMPRMTIGDGCKLGHRNHITCVNEVTIGIKVLTADGVHISDNSHVFVDPETPILEQNVICRGKVSIGNGSWLGENVSVLSATIGKNCVIGANAVVISDIPDYCVAVGIPARVVRRYNPETCTWQKVPKDAANQSTGAE